MQYAKLSQQRHQLLDIPSLRDKMNSVDCAGVLSGPQSNGSKPGLCCYHYGGTRSVMTSVIARSNTCMLVIPGPGAEIGRTVVAAGC